MTTSGGRHPTAVPVRYCICTRIDIHKQVKRRLGNFETARAADAGLNWVHIGMWPVHDTCAELFAMVAILGQSRRPTFRFAHDRTRDTRSGDLVRCCVDLGGMTRELLTDRDPTFCIGSTSEGRANPSA